MYKYVTINSWEQPKYKTIRELLRAEYPGFELVFEDEEANLDADITHGYYVEHVDYGMLENLWIKPYVHFSDGSWNPIMNGFWDNQNVSLEKRK